MRKWWIWLCGALLCAQAAACLAPGPARARGPVLEVAAYLLPPSALMDEAGDLRGETVERVRRILSAMGFEPVFRVLPFKRCLEAMREGTLAMMLPCVATGERRAWMRFSDPMDYMRTVLWAKKGPLVRCRRSLDDLKGLRIGVIPGYRYGPEWQEAVAAGIFTVESSTGRDPYRTNFLMLLENRIDMLVCDRRIGEYLKKLNAPLFDGVMPCPGEIGEGTPLRVPVSLKYFEAHGLSPDEFLARFNAQLAAPPAP